MTENTVHLHPAWVAIACCIVVLTMEVIAQQRDRVEDMVEVYSVAEVLSLPSTSGQKLALLQKLLSSDEPVEDAVPVLSIWLLEPGKATDLELDIAFQILSKWKRLPNQVTRYLESPQLNPGLTRSLLDHLASSIQAELAPYKPGLIQLVQNGNADPDIRDSAFRLLTNRFPKRSNQMEDWIVGLVSDAAAPLTIRAGAVAYLLSAPASIESVFTIAQEWAASGFPKDNVSDTILEFLLNSASLEHNEPVRRLVFRVFTDPSQPAAIRQKIARHIPVEAWAKNFDPKEMEGVISDPDQGDFARASALRWMAARAGESIPPGDQLTDWILDHQNGPLLAGAAVEAMEALLGRSIADPRKSDGDQLREEIGLLLKWERELGEVKGMELRTVLERIGRKRAMLQVELESRLMDRFKEWWFQKKPYAHPLSMGAGALSLLFSVLHLWWRSLALNDPAGLLNQRHAFIHNGLLPPGPAAWAARFLLLDYWSRRPEILDFVARFINQSLSRKREGEGAARIMDQPLKIDGRPCWSLADDMGGLKLAQSGALVKFVGSNGSGKSTLLTLIMSDSLKGLDSSNPASHFRIPVWIEGRPESPSKRSDPTDVILDFLMVNVSTHWPWLTRDLVCVLLENGRFQFFIDDLDQLPEAGINAIENLLRQWDCGCCFVAGTDFTLECGKRAVHCIECLEFSESDARRVLGALNDPPDIDSGKQLEALIAQLYAHRAGLPSSTLWVSILHRLFQAGRDAATLNWGDYQRWGFHAVLRDFILVGASGKKMKKEDFQAVEKVAAWMVEHVDPTDAFREERIQQTHSKEWRKTAAFWEAEGWIQKVDEIGLRVRCSEMFLRLACGKWVREQPENQKFWHGILERLNRREFAWSRELARILAETWMASGSRDEEMAFVEDGLLSSMSDNPVQRSAFKKAFKLTRALHELFRLDTLERKRIIENLRGLGTELRDAAPELLSVLLDGGREIESRQSACSVLTVLNPSTIGNIPALLNLMEDREEYLFLRSEVLAWLKTGGEGVTMEWWAKMLDTEPLEPERFWRHRIGSGWAKIHGKQESIQAGDDS